MNTRSQIERIRLRLESIKEEIAELGRKVDRFRDEVDVLRTAIRNIPETAEVPRTAGHTHALERNYLVTNPGCRACV